MKNIFWFIIISLVLSSNAISKDIPIKKKKIKCLYNIFNKEKVKKEYYKYFIFSNDDSRALELHYGFNTPLKLYRETHRVKKSLTDIIMTPIDGIKRDWILNRQTGEVSEKFNYGTYYYGQCTAVDKNFDPTEYLENLIKNNKKNLIDEIKF